MLFFFLQHLGRACMVSFLKCFLSCREQKQEGYPKEEVQDH